MSVLGLIPARGGSKRIPRKNLALCAGKPLLEWTIEAALSAQSLDQIILSTDDEDIARLGRALGADAPFLRPPELSGDMVPMLPVIVQARNWVQETSATCIDTIVLLQPTSPLRTAHDIDRAVELMRTSGAETVVSVVKVPHQYHPHKVLVQRDTGVEPFLADAPRPGHTGSSLPMVFGRNGPAILVTHASVIDRGELYGAPCLPYVMDQESSIDIDEPLDLFLAECLLERRKLEGVKR